MTPKKRALRMFCGGEDVCAYMPVLPDCCVRQTWGGSEAARVCDSCSSEMWGWNMSLFWFSMLACPTLLEKEILAGDLNRCRKLAEYKSIFGTFSLILCIFSAPN
ncbi:hypothetical protein ILYODFUR_028404 [Ilyodon furcidens]|uniref:Uncharacterized protein n=1 Tax=Ilyodon furcidens TaxID=33524 RepID=A0ABV0VIC5_9TELE